MKIILVKDVDNLGLAGQVLNVAPGYARNFLLPTAAALPATDGNLKLLAQKRAEFERRAKAEKDQSLDLRNRLAELRLTFRRKAGEKGKLYGAVTALDISEALQAQGFDLDRRRLRLSEPFKALGDYEAPIRLHAEVIGSLKISVLPENEEAPPPAAPAEEAAPAKARTRAKARDEIKDEAKAAPAKTRARPKAKDDPAG